MVRIHRCESDVMRNVVTFSVVIDSDLSKDTLREGHTKFVLLFVGSVNW